jgi:hypothetical protein
MKRRSSLTVGVPVGPNVSVGCSVGVPVGASSGRQTNLFPSGWESQQVPMAHLSRLSSKA